MTYHLRSWRLSFRTCLPQNVYLPVLSQKSSIAHVFLYSMLPSKGAATWSKLGEDFNCSWTWLQEMMPLVSMSNQSLLMGLISTMTMQSYKDWLAYCSLRLQTYNNLQYPDARICCPGWRDGSLQVVFLSNTCETFAVWIVGLRYGKSSIIFHGYLG